MPRELFLHFHIYSDALLLDFQLFLYFMVGSDQSCSPEMEIVVEETASVREVRLAAPRLLDSIPCTDLEAEELGRAMHRVKETLVLPVQG